MELSLSNSNTRRIWLVAAALVSILVTAEALRFWVANQHIESNNLDLIQRGARLEPGNADAWDRLGRFHQWDFATSDPIAAVADYQRAVREEPQSPYYWMDLAGAYEQTGNFSGAREAYDKARKAYPVSAEVTWQYGNFLLRQDQAAEGLRQIQRAVGTDYSLLPLAISRVWLTTRDVNQLLDQVLPPDPAAYFKAVDFFQSIHDADSGLLVWQRLLSLGKPFPLPNVYAFLSELIRQNRSDDARKVWLEAIKASGMSRQESSNPSLIWDGGFSQDFANGGLGWRWNAPLGVSIDFDAPRAPNGPRSVRLDFGGGGNTALDAPSQYVAVQPNHTYHFHGYMRTEGITTESGMRFSIVDPHHLGAVNIATANLTGSNPWTSEDIDVSTGPETHFLLVCLYRSPSRLFENKLSGTVWIAEISLVPSDSSLGVGK